MAIWSKQSDWGQSEKSVTLRSLVASMIVVLVVGVLMGYLARGAAGGGSGTKVPVKAFAASNVISTDITGIDVADKSSQGAVRAVTSFITGVPNVALESPQQEQSVLDDIVAPNADPSVRTDLQNTIDTGRDNLVGTGAFPQANTVKLLDLPATYKVDMLAPDRARVQVWFLSVWVDSSTQDVESQWYTNDIQVQWTDHWRIATFSGVAGPTPPLYASGTNAQPDGYPQVVAMINGFYGYRPALATPQQS